MTVTVSLPKSFSSLPTFPKDISVDFTLTASNQNGVDFSGQLNVASLYIGTIQIKNLALGYDIASGIFNGTAAIWPTPFGPSIQTSLTVGPASSESVLGCCVRSFAISVQKINEPLFATGWLLQSIGGSATSATTAGGVAYSQFAGNIGVTFGPQTLKNPAALELDGSMTLALSNPWVLTAEGSATLYSFTLANAKVTYTQGGLIQLEGSVQASIKGYGFSAAVTQPTLFQAGGRYNITATGEVDLGSFGTLTGTVVFSDKGYAACAPITLGGSTWSIGWGVLADGTQTTLDDSCDMSQFTETATPSRAPAPGTALHVSLARDPGLRLLAVHGATAVPAVTLTGPNGLRIQSGMSRVVRSARGLAAPDSSTDTTYLLLPDTPAGRYTLLSSNTTITSVQTAPSLPPVSVQIGTRELRNGRRELTYQQTVTPGQSLDLYDQGTNGTGGLLLRTARARGTLLYTPQPGLGANRDILAITIAPSGQPRNTQALAPYRVNDSPPGRVHGLVRHRQALTWTRAPRAARYILAFTCSGLPTVSIITSKATAAIPAHATTVTILATDATRRPGTPYTLNLHT
jgi:hypothetical protein